jgi:hypothetical protein
MATATTKTKVISVTLTLDGDEAQALADILNRVGGPTEGRRRHADALYGALGSVGVAGDYKADDLDDRDNRAIYFVR